MEQAPFRRIGRYALCAELASGGMATVHVGRLLGPVGFSRTVAIKRLHPHLAKDPEFVSMFLDEARVAARIRHPNVVSVLDVVATKGELFLVMDFVLGESLSRLARAADALDERIPLRIVAAILCDALQGLHAAHETRGDGGEPLDIVHRDVSPQNVLVGTDGVSRVIDFGVAKAAGRIGSTRGGELKGKLSYMAPEQLRGNVTQRTDVFAAGIVLWEVLTGRRLFAADSDVRTFANVLEAPIEPPSRWLPASVDAETRQRVDAVTLKALERDPAKRHATARELAVALHRAIGTASPMEVAEWVETVAGRALQQRAAQVAEIESLSGSSNAPSDGSLVAQIAASESLPPSGRSEAAPVSLGIPRASPVGFAGPPSPPVQLAGGPFDGVPGLPGGFGLGESVATITQPTLTQPTLTQLAPEPPAQMSAVVLSTTVGPAPAAARPPPQRGLWLAALVGLLAMTIVGGVVVTSALWRSRHRVEPAAVAPPEPVDDAVDASPAPEPPPSAPPVASDPAPPPSASAASTPTSTPAPAPTHRPPAPTARPPVRPPPPAPKAKDCSPPYTIDANGRKHYKTECLQ